MIVAGDTARPMWAPDGDDPHRERAVLLRRCEPDSPCGGIGFRLAGITGFGEKFTKHVEVVMSVCHPNSLEEVDDILSGCARVCKHTFDIDDI